MADGVEVAAAKRLMDLLKERGFTFLRTEPGEDGPLWGERETLDHWDTLHICGFSEGCTAARLAKSALLVPGGSLVVARVSGNALEVLQAVSEWEPS